MKGLLLCILAFLFLIALSTILLRHYKGKKYFKALIGAYLIAAVFYSLLYKILPANLGFLPHTWAEPHPGIDFWNGFILLALLYHSYWDFCYATALTGFSSNLLVMLLKSGELNVQEIEHRYSAGGTIDNILAWRLPNLIQGGYLREENGNLRLLPKGRVIAWLTVFLKRLFALGEGG